MQIYVNGKLVKAQILPVDKPTLDETLETFSFALISNDQPMPYAPCQNVQVITDSNEKINLFLVTDAVEVYSLSPTKYKHNITCVQNTRKLSKHLVRNSSFTESPYLEKRSFSSWSLSLSGRVGAGYNGTYSGLGLHSNHIYSSIDLRTINNATVEKIKDAYLEVRCSGILCDMSSSNPPYMKYGTGRWVNDLKNVNDIRNADSSSSFSFENLKLIYSTPGGGDITEDITSNMVEFDGDWYPLNKKIKFDRIKELAKQGYNNFRIGTTPTPINGSVTLDMSEFWMIFTFQVIVTAETYYYNCYEILALLRYRQQKRRRLIGGDWYEEEPLFELPTLEINSDLYSLLTSTPAPNFTFTQCTMYECVAEVFRLFDAIFTMDENGYLGIEYFNDNNGRDVTSTLKKVGQNSSSSEDKYTNGLVAYYQNAKTIEKFPTSDSLYAPIRSKEFGVPASKNSFIFEVPHKIDEILDCFIYYKKNNSIMIKTSWNTGPLPGNTEGEWIVIGETGNAGWQVSGFPILDISHFVIKEDLWTILSNQADMYSNGYLSYPNTRMQINTIFIPNDSNYIDISYTYERYFWHDTNFALDNLINCALWMMFGQTFINSDDDSRERRVYLKNSVGGDWNNIILKTKYVALSEGRVKIESPERKYDGETLIDQYNGAVDLNKMGLNILGLSLKLGNPTLTVTQKITQWENRIKQGDIYNYQDKMWIANVVNYTILGSGYVQATIQFVQNFNNLAMRTKLLREKRMSNISGELTVKSEENIVEYLYVLTMHLDPEQTYLSPMIISTDSVALRDLMGLSLGATWSERPSVEMANIQPDDGNYYYIPMIKYGAGNSICFEISYDHPMSVGKQTKAYANTWFNTTYFTTNIKYTNEYGEIEKVNIGFDGFVQQSQMSPDDFPVLNGSVGRTVISIRDLQYQKQPNEIFALNYQLCFLPYEKDKDFIGSKFINNNYFVDSSRRMVKDIVVYYSNDSFKYSILDTQGQGDTVNVVTTESFDRGGWIRVVITLQNSVQGTSFAICEKGTKEILFASNRPIDGNRIDLCVFPSACRQDKKTLDEF